MGIASRGSGGVARAVTSMASVPSSHNADVDGVTAVMPEEVVGPAAAATGPTDILALVEQIAADHGARSHLAAGDHPPRLDQRSGIALGMAHHQEQAQLLGEIDQPVRLGQ